MRLKTNPRPPSLFAAATTLLVFASSFLTSLQARTPSNGEQQIQAATHVLQSYFEATQIQDFERASQFLVAFERYLPRAKHAARLTYQRNKSFFQDAQIAASELYGAQLTKDFLHNDVVELEGSMTSSNLQEREFKAELVRYRNRWLIRSLKLD